MFEVLRRPVESALTAAIRVHYYTLRVTALHERILERPHRKRRFHTFVDGIPDDLVRADVFDRAHVELALTGPVLCNIGQPLLVEVLGSEIAFDQVITHRGASLLIAAFTCHDH